MDNYSILKIMEKNIKKYESDIGLLESDICLIKISRNKNSNGIINKYKKKIFFNESKNKSYIHLPKNEEKNFLKRITENFIKNLIFDNKPKYKKIIEFEINTNQILKFFFEKSHKPVIKYKKYLFVLSNSEKILLFIKIYIEKRINKEINKFGIKNVIAKYKNNKFDSSKTLKTINFRTVVFNKSTIDFLIDYEIANYIREVIDKNEIRVNNIAFKKGSIQEMLKFRFNLAVDIKRKIDQCKYNYCYMFLDITKAYSCVSISNVIKIVKYYGIDPKVLDYLENMYNDSNIQFHNFDIIEWDYGLFQGFNSSSVLFILYLDYALNDIINIGKRDGFLPKELKIVGSFVDDIVLYIDNIKSHNEFNSIQLYISKKLEDQYNLKLNRDKTKILSNYNGILKFWSSSTWSPSYQVHSQTFNPYNKNFEYLKNHDRINPRNHELTFLGLRFPFPIFNKNEFDNEYDSQINSYIELIKCLKDSLLLQQYFIQTDLLLKIIRLGLLHFFIYGAKLINNTIDKYIPEFKFFKENIFKYMLVESIKLLRPELIYHFRIGYFKNDKEFVVFEKAQKYYNLNKNIIHMSVTFKDIIPDQCKIMKPKNINKVTFDDNKSKQILNNNKMMHIS